MPAGYGLDFIWPFLLKYPRDKVGTKRHIMRSVRSARIACMGSVAAHVAARWLCWRQAPLGSGTSSAWRGQDLIVAYP